jgi:uncharacterized Zn ribbon protein
MKIIMLMVSSLVILGCSSDILDNGKIEKINNQTIYTDYNGNQLIWDDEIGMHGIVEISAFYSKDQRMSSPEYDYYPFELTVAKAPSIFIEHYKQLVKDGNTINRIKNGRLVINIEEKKVEGSIEELKASTIRNPLKLLIEINKSRESEAYTYCGKLKIIK